MTMTAPTTRSRTYAFLAYTDSSPEDWKTRLAEEHIPAYISPLHDRDLNEDGTGKKPHWHVLFVFNAKKSIAQVNEIRARVLGENYNKAFEKVNDKRAYARYLCHLDDPEKAQYKTEDVTVLGGAEPYMTLITTEEDDLALFGEIVDYICDHPEIKYFHQFVRHVKTARPDYWKLIMRKYAFVTVNLFQSRSAERKAIMRGEDPRPPATLKKKAFAPTEKTEDKGV